MSSRTGWASGAWRVWSVLLAVVLLVASAGCSGCEEDPCAGACAAGEACVDGACVPTISTCPGGCPAGQLCAGGRCVSDQPQCRSVAQECDPSRPTTAGFVCVDFDGAGRAPGTCVSRCGAGGACPSGSLCFYLRSALDGSCASDAQCPTMQSCIQGACRDSICRPSECTGFVEGAETCTADYAGVAGFELGGQCHVIEGGARYCYPAGPRLEGEPCTDAMVAIQADDFSGSCASGLACVDGTCHRACQDDESCDGQACLDAAAGLVDVGVGICGETCTPFAAPGQCGPGRACRPLSSSQGICTDAGTTAAFEACQPGAGQCVEGTTCVSFRAADPAAGAPAVARCQPICDVGAGPANDDGLVGEFAQAQRDATCPQPPEPGAYLGLINLAEPVGPVDVYLDEAPTPLVEDLGFEEQSDADADRSGPQLVALEPGAHVLRVLPAGAPSTDPLLAELRFTAASARVVEVIVLPVAGVVDEAEATRVERGVERPGSAGGYVTWRFFHGLVDAGPIDVVLVPPGDDLADPDRQLVLAAGLAPREALAGASVPVGVWDLLVFDAGAPRTDRDAALLVLADQQVGGGGDLALLRGSLDPDDFAPAGLTTLRFASAPVDAGGSGGGGGSGGAGEGASFTCVSLSGEEAFGFCQQSCGDDPSRIGADYCQGQGLGCTPTFRDELQAFQTLCAPVGQGAEGEPCDPFEELSSCAEGLYCLEYGNGVADYDPGRRGRCTPLCALNDDALRCPEAMACRPLDYGGDYPVGECGFPCEPGETYGDAACPAGLRACKPVSSLRDDPAGGPPTVQAEQPFCSASGAIPAGAACGGADCTPGAECLYPRSTQTTQVATLLSPYFGGYGLAPSCRPQCDPFDAAGGPTPCEQGETCLFNYPWSADVGHCAPIVEQVAPGQACTRPGEACGEDAICVVDGMGARCLRFCEYLGGIPGGAYERSTCPSGFGCAPLISDIGLCIEPG